MGRETRTTGTDTRAALHGLGGHGVSDHEVMTDEEPVGPCLSVRSVVQQKVKHGGHGPGEASP